MLNQFLFAVSDVPRDRFVETPLGMALVALGTILFLGGLIWFGLWYHRLIKNALDIQRQLTESARELAEAMKSIAASLREHPPSSRSENSN